MAFQYFIESSCNVVNESEAGILLENGLFTRTGGGWEEGKKGRMREGKMWRLKNKIGKKRIALCPIHFAVSNQRSTISLQDSTFPNLKLPVFVKIL